MSDQRYDYIDDDDLEDDLGVASHVHEERASLQHGSAFSRGSQGVASFAPVENVPQAAPRPASQAPQQPRSTPLVQPQRVALAGQQASAPRQAAADQRPQRQQRPQQAPRQAAGARPTASRAASASRTQQAAPTAAPRTERRPQASRQQVPAQQQLRRPQRPRDVASADANRAAFDARYGSGRGEDRYASRREGKLKGMLNRWRARRANRPARRHPGLRFLAGLVVATVALYLVFCLPIDLRIAFDEPEASQVSGTTSAHLPFAPYYVLLLGSDAREGDEVSRSDSMILTRVDVLRNQITMISIPRDTMVEIPGQGTQKINAAYAFGGTAGAIDAVEGLLGVDVSEAAVVHFDGISGLVDALGGITVKVPVDVSDPVHTGLELPAGTYDMDGETALQFSRVRHGFALGDYQRQADQQIVLKAIVDKVRTLAPWELIGVGTSAGDLFDTSMRCYDVAPILARMLLGSPTIYQCSLPSTTQMVDGVSYVVLDRNAAVTLMNVIDAGGDPADAGVTLGLEG